MSRPLSGPLAAWATTWLAEGGPADDVIGAVTGTDAPHQVLGLLGSSSAAPLSAALIAWRRAGGPVRLVLPVAGDVRGVPGPGEFRTAALEAGEAVVGTGLGLVPEVIDYAPSSAPPSVHWHAFEIDAVPADHLDVSTASHELATAIRACAEQLSAAEVSGASGELLAGLSSARRAGDVVNLPPGFAPRAVALVAQAERLSAVLELVEDDPLGGAVDQHGAAARDAALRPLATAVRRARLAGYNAAAEDR